jgi:O-antigen/teichoic acid export membrane protein
MAGESLKDYNPDIHAESIGTARRILRNFSSLVFANLFDTLLRFIAYIYLARALGSEGFGMTAFAYSTWFFFASISDFGLRMFGIREVAKKKYSVKKYFSNIISLKIGFSIVAFIGMCLFLLVINQEAVVKQMILIYGISLLFNTLLIDWVFLGREEMHYVAMAIIIRGSLACLLLISVVKGMNQILLVPAIESLSFFSATLFLIIMYRVKIGPIKLRIDIPFWKEILPQSFPFGISLIMIRVHSLCGIILLGLMDTNDAVGLLRSAIMIPNLLNFLGLIYMDSIFPVVSRFFISAKDKLKKLLAYSIKLSISIGLPISVGGTYMASSIIPMFFGQEYEEAILAFQILIWMPFLVYVGIIYRNSLAACNQQKYYSLILTFRVLAAVVLSVVLIPKFSGIGVAVALVISEVINLSLSYFLFYNKIGKLHFMRYLIKPILSSAAMLLFLILFANFHPLVNIFIAGFLYFIVMLMVRGFTKEEFFLLKMYVSSRGAQSQTPK